MGKIDTHFFCLLKRPGNLRKLSGCFAISVKKILFFQLQSFFHTNKAKCCQSGLYEMHSKL